MLLTEIKLEQLIVSWESNTSELSYNDPIRKLVKVARDMLTELKQHRKFHEVTCNYKVELNKLEVLINNKGGYESGL